LPDAGNTVSRRSFPSACRNPAPRVEVWGRREVGEGCGYAPIYAAALVRSGRFLRGQRVVDRAAIVEFGDERLGGWLRHRLRLGSNCWGGLLGSGFFGCDRGRIGFGLQNSSRLSLAGCPHFVEIRLSRSACRFGRRCGRGRWRSGWAGSVKERSTYSVTLAPWSTRLSQDS